MNEFKFQRARVGAWARYLNIPFIFWFASDIPMPLDKDLLLVTCSITLAANVIFHLHLELTKRFLAGSYLMLACDQCTIAGAIYASGVAASPFLLVYPLLPFSAYYVDFSRRAAVAFGVAGLVLLATVYVIWWRQDTPVILWNPREFPVFIWCVCVVQVLLLGAYIFLATEANPLVEELGRREQVLLKQAHRAELGTSLSMVAHELRGPLTTIGFSLELIEQQAKGTAAEARLARTIGTARQEIERMGRMVTDTLAFARERRGQMQPVAAAPAAVVARALEFLNMRWGRHRRNFTVEADLAGAPAIWCDADAMHQVLVNLLDNALQHPAPDRPVRIEIPWAEGPDGLTLTIRDNGAGIPPDQLARIFEGFVTTRPEGTGLGLPICRQLIQDQGGTIEVTSTVGVGTTVNLRLPTKPPAAALAVAPATATKPAGRRLTRGRSRAPAAGPTGA